MVRLKLGSVFGERKQPTWHFGRQHVLHGEEVFYDLSTTSTLAMET